MTWKAYYANSERVQQHSGERVVTLLQDHLGGTSRQMQNSDMSVKTVRYEVWGEARGQQVDRLETDLGYTGQEKGNLGFYYYDARWYDPYLNRWLQLDSIIPDINNPLHLDPYSGY